uniref:Uncharacterized protein n=1 Tax=Oryza nivara TaxID=4536 RepID=A0A0E0G2U7_ORYNI
MSKKRREGGGGGNIGCDPPVINALSMDGGLREVSLSVVFSVWCLLLLLLLCSQFLHSQTDPSDFYDYAEDGMRENYCKLDKFRNRILQGKAENGRVPDSAAAHRLEPSGGEYNYAAASKGSKVLAHNREAKDAANILGAMLLCYHTAPLPRSSATSAPRPPHSSAATLLCRPRLLHLRADVRAAALASPCRPPVPALVLAVRERKE